MKNGDFVEARSVSQGRVEGEVDFIPNGDIAIGLAIGSQVAALQITKVADVVD